MKNPWINKSKSAARRRRDTGHVYQVIKMRDVSVPLEEKLNASRSTRVLQKSESKKHESVFIHTKNKADLQKAKDEGHLVVRVPQKKALNVFEGQINGKKAFFPEYGQVCSASETFDQASKIDALGDNSILAKGTGVLIIIWDFLPTQNSLAKVEEFEGRPGGGLTIYRNKSDSIANHGVQVASIAAGKYAGPATGSTLALLGLGDNVLRDLSLIESLAEFFKGPVVVNMSFALEWSKVSADEVESINEFIDVANQMMQEMTEKYKILFFVAAGNESVNMCNSTKPISFNTGSSSYERVMSWPQFARSKTTPFTQVGATKVTDAQGRPLAIYSNYGDCVKIYTHGGVVCGWDVVSGAFATTQGTSFASPLVAGVAAALFSEDLNRSGGDVLKIIEENATSTVSDLPSGSSSVNKFMQVPALDPTPEGKPISLPQESDLINEDTKVSARLDNEAWWESVMPGVVIVMPFLIIVLVSLHEFFNKKKRLKKPLKVKV